MRHDDWRTYRDNCPHDLHGSRGTLPPPCLSPEPKPPAFGSWLARKLGRVNWFIVALCLATLGWFIYRALMLRAGL